MRSFTVLSILLIFILAACGPQAMTEPMSAQVELATPTAAASAKTPSPLPTQTPAPSATVTPTFGPTATETLLPTLELPTLEAVEPALDIWDGQPTYLAESQPGYFFRVKYNPSVWGLTQDSYGQPALGHRSIEYCIIAPAFPRGMPPGTQVEHDTRQIGKLFFEINTVLINGQRQFVTYQATDNIIFTSFQVNFVAELDACLADAEAVFASLTSVPELQATPIP
jgi:hypothetical protein